MDGPLDHMANPYQQVPHQQQQQLMMQYGGSTAVPQQQLQQQQSDEVRRMFAGSVTAAGSQSRVSFHPDWQELQPLQQLRQLPARPKSAMGLSDCDIYEQAAPYRSSSAAALAQQIPLGDVSLV